MFYSSTNLSSEKQIRVMGRRSCHLRELGLSNYCIKMYKMWFCHKNYTALTSFFYLLGDALSFPVWQTLYIQWKPNCIYRMKDSKSNFWFDPFEYFQINLLNHGHFILFQSNTWTLKQFFHYYPHKNLGVVPLFIVLRYKWCQVTQDDGIILCWSLLNTASPL